MREGSTRKQKKGLPGRAADQKRPAKHVLRAAPPVRSWTNRRPKTVRMRSDLPKRRVQPPSRTPADGTSLRGGHPPANRNQAAAGNQTAPPAERGNRRMRPGRRRPAAEPEPGESTNRPQRTKHQVTCGNDDNPAETRRAGPGAEGQSRPHTNRPNPNRRPTRTQTPRRPKPGEMPTHVCTKVPPVRQAT